MHKHFFSQASFPHLPLRQTLQPVLSPPHAHTQPLRRPFPQQARVVHSPRCCVVCRLGGAHALVPAVCTTQCNRHCVSRREEWCHSMQAMWCLSTQVMWCHSTQAMLQWWASL